MKRVIHLLTVIFLALISASPAAATSVVNTSPTAGSVLSVSPTAVTVKANANLLVGANDLTVIDPNGTRVDDGSVQIQGEVLMVGLKVLKSSGLYTVNYTLMAIDEEPINGSFTFLYNAPADMASATPTPSPEVSKTNTTSGGSNGAIVFVIVIFLLGCGMLLFLIWYARTLWHQNQKKRRKAVRKKSDNHT